MSNLSLILVFAPAMLAQPGPAAAQLAIDGALVKLLEEVEVPAQVDGVLAAMLVKEGAPVRPDDVLARLEDADARLALERSATELEVARRQADSDVKLRLARKSAELASMEHKRALDSIERFKKSVPESDLDRLRLAMERAALEVEQAQEERQNAQSALLLKQAEHRLAEFALERRRIRSSMTGVVVQRHFQAGEWVPAGKSVVRLVRLDRLRVEGFVNYKKLPADAVGRDVRLQVELPGGKPGIFAGQVVFLHPEVDPVNGQVRVWAEVDNADLQLQPGMRGTLLVDLGQPPPQAGNRHGPARGTP